MKPMIEAQPDTTCLHCHALYAKNEWQVDLGLCGQCRKQYVMIDEARVCRTTQALPKPAYVADMNQHNHFADLLKGMGS